MIIEGYLRSYTPAGKDTGYISINVRSGIVEMFGSKEKKKENKIDNKSRLRFEGCNSRNQSRRVTYLIYRS